MYPRTDILYLFSTFAQFSNDRFDSWVSDLRLVRSMEKQQSRLAPSMKPQSEEFWVLHWHQQWQEKENANAVMHLCAYLQDACYWAAKNITRRFSSVNYTVADGFQDAITHIERILTHYDPAQGNSLKAYARTAFSNIIRNQIRQQKAANICSDWGLLRKLSKKQLQHSLQLAGFNQTDADILLWQCFKAVCVPGGSQAARRTVRQLCQPTVEQLENIAVQYNQLRVRQSPAENLLDAEGVAERLKKLVQAARSLVMPKTTSLNQLQCDDYRERIDELKVEDTPMTLMLSMEAHNERQDRRQAIELVLTDAIAHLDAPVQKLLSLYYQENTTQQKIASQLQVKQYQVSRQLNRARQQLLHSIAQWSQDTLHISIDSAVLANMGSMVHQWLQQYYSSRGFLLFGC
ncbi:MAG: sigma-70 family RNA polymerase sigma factor [Phormidesmis sp.]